MSETRAGRALQDDECPRRSDRAGPFGDPQEPAGVLQVGKERRETNLLSEVDLDRYRERTAEMAPPHMLVWLHRDFL